MLCFRLPGITWTEGGGNGSFCRQPIVNKFTHLSTLFTYSGYMTWSGVLGIEQETSCRPVDKAKLPLVDADCKQATQIPLANISASIVFWEAKSNTSAISLYMKRNEKFDVNTSLLTASANNARTFKCSAIGRHLLKICSMRTRLFKNSCKI